jgi:hypothetical protein
VVTLNAIAAVSGAAASLRPGGSAKSISADSVDGVLTKMTEAMAQARSDLAEREKDVTSALQHNWEALASLRHHAEDAADISPVVPPQPTIMDAAPGTISSRLRPGVSCGILGSAGVFADARKYGCGAVSDFA